MIGAITLTDCTQLVDAETARMRARFVAAGSVGMNQTERQQRRAEPRAMLRRLQAQRELLWRQRDTDDAFVQRPDIDLAGGEMFLLSDTDLKEIANGREATARHRMRLAFVNL